MKFFVFLIACIVYIQSCNAQTFATGNIFNQGEITLFGDVLFNSIHTENPDGIIHFSSLKTKNNVNISNSNIQGVVDFEGDDKTTLMINKNCLFGSLRINKAGFADIELSGDSLIIERKLQLINGRIKNIDAVLQLKNTDNKSIQFNEYAYIIGGFNQKTVKGIEYSIPVGDEEHLHLIKLTDLDTEQNTLKSNFTEGLPLGINKPGVLLSDHGYWTLSTRRKTSCNLIPFYKTMKLLNQKKPSIIQLQEDGNNTYTELIHSAKHIDYAEYCFLINVILDENESKLLVFDNQENSSEAWINFISLSSGSDTRFIIQDLNTNYTNIEISIYNNWGNRIYKSNNYQNDFEAKEYPEGTYYYQASFKTNNSEQRINKNGFFEIKD